MFSNLPWSGTGLTSCSLRAASRLLVTAVMLRGKPSVKERREAIERKRKLRERDERGK